MTFIASLTFEVFSLMTTACLSAVLRALYFVFLCFVCNIVCMCLHQSTERSSYENEDITDWKYRRYISLCHFEWKFKVDFSVSLNIYFLVWVGADIDLCHSGIWDIKYTCTMEPAAGFHLWVLTVLVLKKCHVQPSGPHAWNAVLCHQIWALDQNDIVLLASHSCLIAILLCTLLSKIWHCFITSHFKCNKVKFLRLPLTELLTFNCFIGISIWL
jgi:hypothetical protein